MTVNAKGLNIWRVALSAWYARALSVGALALLLAGCATSSKTGALAATLTPASTATPTLAPTLAPTAPTGGVGHTCDLSKITNPVTEGDLVFSAPTVLYGFNTDYLLPDGLPNRPLAVAIVDNSAHIQGKDLQSESAVGTVAFVFGVCNASKSQSHLLSEFGATVSSLTPYNGQVNTLNACAFLYARPTGIGGECASGYSPDVEVSVAFDASAALGALETVAPSAPVALAPGSGVDVSIGILPPTTPSIESFRLGLSVDGGAYMSPALDTAPVINAPIARRWDGNGCSTPSMQAQLPSSYPANTYFACPPA